MKKERAYKPNLAVRDKHKSAGLHIVMPETTDEERKRWFGLPPRKLEGPRIWRSDEPRF